MAAGEMVFSTDGRTLAAARGPGDPVLFDLSYHDRHVAGNLRHHLARLGDGLGEEIDAELLESWAGERTLGD